MGSSFPVLKWLEMPFWVGPFRSYFRQIPLQWAGLKQVCLTASTSWMIWAHLAWHWAQTNRFLQQAEGERLDLGTICAGCFPEFWAPATFPTQICYAFDFAKHTLPHVSTCLAVFCFSLQTVFQPGFGDRLLPTSLIPWTSLRPWTQA